jgi:serine/threonine protein kinase/ribosomal protein S27AE
MTAAAARTANHVRCPSCGASIPLAAGDTRLSCTACGLAAPVSRVGTAPGAALVELEPDLAGATVGGHAVVERIGAGGMGTVYRAQGPSGEVAIKVLRPGLGVDRAAVLARFAREAAALRRLDHPRVVRFLDHGQDGDIAYIVTELVGGRDLAARLAAGPLALREVVEIFGQVCDGVAAAHAAGIVHRDLKPANILVGGDGGDGASVGVKVADFGLAQLGPDVAVTTLTRTDVAMGTFHYLAPEQRKDARNVDHRADIWALGVILYEMLTGELPLGSFTPPSNRRAAAIVRRALAPDPAARFASVTELGNAVRALVPRPVRRSRVIAAVATLVVLGGASAGAAFALLSSSSSSSPPARAITSPSPSFKSPGYGGAPGTSLGSTAGSAALSAATDAFKGGITSDGKSDLKSEKDDPKAAPDEKGTRRPAITKRPTPKPAAPRPPASKPATKPSAGKRPASTPAKLSKEPDVPDDDAAGEDAAGEDAAPPKPSPAELKKGKGKRPKPSV